MNARAFTNKAQQYNTAQYAKSKTKQNIALKKEGRYNNRMELFKGTDFTNKVW